jgi:predicted phosphate transport protein (TIGR00153 family)
MYSIFKVTKDLVMKIDTYIDLVCESVLHFEEGLKLYLSGKESEFNERLDIIKILEGRADDLRQDIEAQLYVQTLIPESRGDVLQILENMDDIIDYSKTIMFDFFIEKPEIPPQLHDRIRKLAEVAVDSTQALVQATRSYFYDVNSVKDHLHKVKFFENESDHISEKSKREIFQLDIDLEKKLHLKNFIVSIDAISDVAEKISNRLSIAAMKRII